MTHNGKEITMANEPLEVTFFHDGCILTWSGRINGPNGAENIAGVLNLAEVNVVNMTMSARSDVPVCNVHAAGLGFDLQIGPFRVVDGRTILAAVLALMAGQSPAEAIKAVPDLLTGRAEPSEA